MIDADTEPTFIIKFWDGEVKECWLDGEWYTHLLHSGYSIHKDDKRIKEIKPVPKPTPACQHNNAVLSDDNEPATYHCPDCGENFIGTE